MSRVLNLVIEVLENNSTLIKEWAEYCFQFYIKVVIAKVGDGKYEIKRSMFVITQTPSNLRTLIDAKQKLLSLKTFKDRELCGDKGKAEEEKKEMFQLLKDENFQQENYFAYRSEGKSNEDIKESNFMTENESLSVHPSEYKSDKVIEEVNQLKNDTDRETHFVDTPENVIYHQKDKNTEHQREPKEFIQKDDYEITKYQREPKEFIQKDDYEITEHQEERKEFIQKDENLGANRKTFVGLVEGNTLVLYNVKGDNGFIRPSLWSLKDLEKKVKSGAIKEEVARHQTSAFNFKFPTQQHLSVESNEEQDYGFADHYHYHNGIYSAYS